MSPRKPTDLDKLQGTWRVTSLAMDGEEMPNESFVDATITIRGSEFSSTGMGYDYAGTIEIIAGKKQSAFDLAFSAGPPAGTRNRGIYALDGDEWTICLATRGDARPRSFATRADSGIALETLQRDVGSRRVGARRKGGRPRVQSRAAAPASTKPAPAGTATEIEGDWAMVSAVLDGKPLAPDMVKWCKRITRGNVTQILAGPQSMLDAEFTLDASHTPGHIDYVNRSGKNKGKGQAGIYDIAGDVLRICMSAPGDARPAEFSSTRGDGRSFTVWRLSER
jgi:uncharacterized protein (TIGR03067 family)